MFTLPTIIATLIGGAWLAQSKRKAVTPKTEAERKAVYDLAINELKDPEKFITLAVAFRNVGMEAEAEMLEKRAALISAPKDVKDARREAYKKGMASQDMKGVRELAKAFSKMGATGAAAKLWEHATTIENTAEVANVEV